MENRIWRIILQEHKNLQNHLVYGWFYSTSLYSNQWIRVIHHISVYFVRIKFVQRLSYYRPTTDLSLGLSQLEWALLLQSKLSLLYMEGPKFCSTSGGIAWNPNLVVSLRLIYNITIYNIKHSPTQVIIFCPNTQCFICLNFKISIIFLQ